MKKDFAILGKAIWLVFCLFVFLGSIKAQEAPTTNPKSALSPKKTNHRPSTKNSKSNSKSNLFEKATVEMMAEQCVKLETEAGTIELEMYPESAPESVRGFLNLAAYGAFDTTTFNRIVKGFIIQGGDLATREKLTPELAIRSRKTIPDEPNLIKHDRGILSMARTDSPNSATTSFFILVGPAKHLDGTFAAFGRVTRGMEFVDTINKMSVEGEKPIKPVRIIRSTVTLCQKPLTTQ